MTDHKICSEFLADVAHEFQTPLAILWSSIEALAPSGTTSSRSRHLNRTERMRITNSAQSTIEQLSQLIENLLEAARLDKKSGYSETDRQSKKPRVDFMKINMAELLEEAYYDCTILMENAGISFSLWISENATNASFFGDRSALKRVLFNLLSNALKYTPSGGAISLAMKVSLAEGRLEENEHDDYQKIECNKLEVLIADTGSGISKENLPHIFERLYTIPPDIAPNIPIGPMSKNFSQSGHGIGLYLSRSIIESHGGSISVESELGSGSRFTISLPFSIEREIKINSPNPSYRRQSKSESAPKYNPKAVL